MLRLYLKICKLLDKRERRLALLVLLLTTVVAFIEVLGVASIMPFMAVLANPDVIEKSSVLLYVYEALDFETKDAYLFFLGIVVFVMLVGSTFLRALVVWVQVYYSNLRVYSISTRLVSGYLNKPYCWFLTHNGSKLSASILEEVSRVVHGTLHPALRLVSHTLIASLMMILFMLVDPVLAISTVILLGITYGSIFKFASSRLAKNGRFLSTFQRGRHKAIQEAFAGIKDVKLMGLENSFLHKYRTQTRNFALKLVAIKLWAEMPSFGMQALVFGGMMVIILYLMKYSGSLEDTIPVLALYALGGYKLMPSLQEIYKQLAEIKGSQSALDDVLEDIQTIDASYAWNEKDRRDRLAVSDCFELKNIQYSYPDTDKLVLDGLSLVIERNTTVGFVGGSGSGKTTTVDILLGLLPANHGELLVDHQVVGSDRMRSWQNNLGYVPQHIFLTDDSIAANIAYGIPDDEIDHAAVKSAAQTASLHEFIESELPEGYDTHVGERGVRLSGGQRQRIGIARALYHDPDILILDEATSALDNLTEKSVMDAVKALGHKKTIILVAHRLSTVQSCDKIFLFEKGGIAASGNYRELTNHSEKFKEMALLQNNK